MSERPIIFVVGNPRSGTTMMGRILGNHPSVYTFPNEIHFFENLWATEDADRGLSISEASDLAARLLCIANDRFFSQGDRRRFDEKARLIIQNVNGSTHYPASIYEAFLRYITAENKKTIPCEQTPGYVYYVREILSLFPDARIINMVRDPRDVLLSQKNRWKRRFLSYKKPPRKAALRTWLNYHPISTSGLWNAATRATNVFADDKRVCVVRFEDILSKPREELQRICLFIGIPYQENMLDVPKVGSSLIADRPNQRGIDRERTANWRNGGLNSAEIFINQIITARRMRELGYAPVKVFPSPFALVFYVVIFPVKLFFSFLLHLRYIKNIKEAIERRLGRSSSNKGTPA
jgi:hypothetical protein